ncbi:hypothetical protein M8494_24670 [Serratia ureilytica]
MAGAHSPPALSPRSTPVQPAQRAISAMPSMQILLLAPIAPGTIVGTVDVISVARRAARTAAAASIVLSVYAFGSCLAGLITAQWKIPSPCPRLFLHAAFATAFTNPAAAGGIDVSTLAAAMFVAGLFFAPTMIGRHGLLNIVPPSRLDGGVDRMVTGLGIAWAAPHWRPSDRCRRIAAGFGVAPLTAG